MAMSNVSHPSAHAAIESGRFAWSGCAVAVVAALAAGLTFGWIGVTVQRYFAPLILFPMLLGAAAGLTIVGVSRFARIGHRPTILLAALLAGGLAVAANTTSATWRPTWSTSEANARPRDATLPPSSGRLRRASPSILGDQARHGRPLVGEHVIHGTIVWLWWALDGLLAAVTAAAAAIPAVRVPYCNRCGSWYRSVRSGRLDMPTATRLAGLLGIEDTDKLHSPRYRLLTCQSGCGAVRCELSWEDSAGALYVVRLWLDAEARQRVAALLDGRQGARQKSQRFADRRADPQSPIPNP